MAFVWAGWQAAKRGRTARMEAKRDRVNFAAGSMVRAGLYRNVDTGVLRYCDGETPLPKATTGAAWELLSDEVVWYGRAR